MPDATNDARKAKPRYSISGQVSISEATKYPLVCAHKIWSQSLAVVNLLCLAVTVGCSDLENSFFFRSMKTGEVIVEAIK